MLVPIAVMAHAGFVQQVTPVSCEIVCPLTGGDGMVTARPRSGEFVAPTDAQAMAGAGARSCR